MSEAPAQSNAEQTTPDRISFDYIKSNLFRVVHMDGAIGGGTPNGYVHMSIFSERPPIPKRVVYHIEAGSRMGAEILEERDVRDAVVRELELDCIMSVETAEALHNWLAQTIAKVRDARPQMNEEDQ